MNGLEPKITELINRANQLVKTVVNENGISSSLIPKFLLATRARQVQADRLNRATGMIDDVTTIPLTEIVSSFVLDWQQLSDLSQAIERAKTAMRTYSRLQDRLLLLGYVPAPIAGPPGDTLGGGGMPPGAWVNRGHANEGLLGAITLRRDAAILEGIAVAQGMLEDWGHPRPVAVAMSRDLVDIAAQRQQGFADTLRQRIEDLVGSTNLRTTVLPARTAILMSEFKAQRWRRRRKGAERKRSAAGWRCRQSGRGRSLCAALGRRQPRTVSLRGLWSTRPPN